MFFFHTTNNFVDLGKVLDIEDTLETTMKNLLFESINSTSPRWQYFSLNEHRVELYDDRINLMGLSEPKELNYFNAGETVRDVGSANGADHTVSISLSPKVLI